VQNESAVDISDEIDRLSQKSQQLTKDIYASLTPWQVTQIARHPQRPYTLDYVNEVFTDFQELHGDRHYADDLSIVGGLARFNGQACMVLGHQKGRDTKERTQRNFGMSRPEGYRKALRLMKLAEKFGLPVFTFVDTPGCLPRHRRRRARPVRSHRAQHLRDGAARSAHRQHHHRRRRLRRCAGHQRGRPGADAAVQRLFGDLARRLRGHPVEDGRARGEAADALGITAHRLKALGVIDKIVNEPVGGAHRDMPWMASQLKRALLDACARRPTSSPRTCCSAATSACSAYGRFTDTKER
jgi:acetyl-CoA carboxylase carboxyl transferase subunit alpha